MAGATTSATRIDLAKPSIAHSVTARTILVSIHDVSPRFEREVTILRERLARFVPANRIAMLVIPDHWGSAKLTPGSPFAGQLRAWADAGTEMLAHGWYHRDDTPHQGRLARTKAKHMTAGEGEFLGLSREVARQRMADGRDLIEGITGRAVGGFVAPAWLYGEGARQAASDVGFAMCEDHFRVWRPADGRILARGPVITWASRSRARIASSLLAANVLPPLLRFAPVVRMAVHPGDAGVPSLLVSIDDTLRRLCRSHVPARYDALLPG